MGLLVLSFWVRLRRALSTWSLGGTGTLVARSGDLTAEWREAEARCLDLTCHLAYGVYTLSPCRA